MTAQATQFASHPVSALLREDIGAIAVLTLNRPAARNSLSEGLIAELHAVLNDIHDDKSVRAVVIAANGPAFSAGHDMKELTARRTDADRGDYGRECGGHATDRQSTDDRTQDEPTGGARVALASTGFGNGVDLRQHRLATG